jgi:hypothetical protein
MSYVTAADHCPTELEFVSADDVLNIVTYRAISRSGANGAYNHASLDVHTGETHCSCKAAATGRECWHVTLLPAAFDAHPARTLAARYTSEQLLAAGTKAARMVRVYRRRTWRVLPADQVAVVACRAEWFRRRQTERAGEAVAA